MKQIVCFGDSLTEGYGAAPGESWPALLQKRVAAPVINAGVNGDTTADALRRLDRDVLARDPALVVVEFGANDMFNDLTCRGRVDMAGFEGRYRLILDRLCRAPTDKERFPVFLAKFYIRAQISDGDAGKETVPGFTSALFQSFETLFASLARDYPVTLIDDIWSGIWGKAHLKYDTIHPNGAGYAVMFERFWDALKAAILNLKETNHELLVPHERGQTQSNISHKLHYRH